MNTIDLHPALTLDMTGHDTVQTAGRKGIAYDWQALLAADGVSEIEATLSELVLESAE